jgi:hypothetical protein
MGPQILEIVIVEYVVSFIWTNTHVRLLIFSEGSRNGLQPSCFRLGAVSFRQ